MILVEIDFTKKTIYVHTITSIYTWTNSPSRSAEAGRFRLILRGDEDRGSSNLSLVLLFSVSLMDEGDK